MPGCYIYCRNWTGFTDEFPFYNKLNSLPDDILAERLDAVARAWLREHKEAVKARFRKTKAGYRKSKARMRGLRKSLQRSAAVRPHGSPPQYTRTGNNSRVKSSRTEYLEWVRGPRRSPLSERVARIAGWSNSERIVGVPSPSRVIYLGRVSDGELAQEIATNLTANFKGSDSEPERLRFGVRPCDEIGKVNAARIELEIDELPNRTDDLARFHRWVLTEYGKLVSKIGAAGSGQAAKSPGAAGGGKSPASMELEVDPAAKIVRWNGKRVEINSHADFAVFSAVHSARGAIVLYLELLRAVKPDNVSDKIQSMPTAPPEVKEAVAHINAALKQVDCPNSFDNVRRQGYRLLSSDE